MRKTVLLFLWLALSVPVVAGEEPTDTAERQEQKALEKWLAGKSTSEVIELLGEPSKRKRRQGQEVFVYRWGRSVTRPPAFPGSLVAKGAPVPVAASPQPSDSGAAAVGGSKAPPIPPNWRELRDSAESEALQEKQKAPSTALKITFGPDDRVSSCRMVPRKKNKRAATEPDGE